MKCEYCNTTGSYQWINSSHQEECPKYPVECPNHCEAGHVRREEISRHLEECPLAITKCWFVSDSMLTRANITEHTKVVAPHIKCILPSTSKQLQNTKRAVQNRVHKIQNELDSSNQTFKQDNDGLGNLLKETQALYEQKETHALYRKPVDYKTNERPKLAQKNKELQSEINKIRKVNDNLEKELQICKQGFENLLQATEHLISQLQK